MKPSSLSKEQVVPLQVKEPKSSEASSVALIADPRSETLADRAPSATLPPELMVRVSETYASARLVSVETVSVESSNQTYPVPPPAKALSSSASETVSLASVMKP